MSIPNHSEDCIRKSYPTYCPDCGQEVFYFCCSCGSKVFFDELHYPWPQHHCRQYELRSALQIIRESGRLTDDETWNRVQDYSKKHGKTISDEFYEILEAELTRRRKPFKCIDVSFDEKIKGISGQIFEINSNVNFARRMGLDPTSPIIQGLLGELAKNIFTEIIIRDSPDKENHSRQYSVFIESSKLRGVQIKRSDIITVKVRGSKSHEKYWVISNIQKM
jgi:transcription termination factor Rho